ncbi:FAD-dependent oxidoreductase [Streptomyces sp. NPDC059740]|uniref:FAD-dependent oxidoreductase n=1 Tax=Streptomyces sp. NPDC059740 TaxID=3346926 RepID=UPI0036542F62
MSFDRRAFLRYGGGAVAAGVLTGGWSAPSSALPAGTTIPWDRLRTLLQGTLVLPSDAAYPVAKELFFSQYDTVSPAAVAYCTSEQDVQQCLRFAQDHGVALVPRSGGHSHAGYSTGPGLVLDLSALNSLTVNPAAGSADTPTVTVGPGVQQIDSLTALAPAGLALVGGSCPTVGAAGFLQGGGYGLLSPSAGMGCDHLLSARVVLADGSVVTASAKEHPDLFWALRGGGGGNFGVVTSFEVSPLGITSLVNYSLTWGWDVAAQVLGAWQEWVARGPRELGTTLTVALTDAAPGTAAVLNVSGAWRGSVSSLNQCLDDLTALVGSAPDTRQADQLSYRDAMMAHYGCADDTAAQCHRVGVTADGLLPRGTFLTQRNRMFRTPLPGSGVSGLLAAFDADRRAGHTRLLSAAGLGGAINDVARDATAYVHRDTVFQLIGIDTVGTADPAAAEQAAAQSWVTGVFEAMDPYSNGESYQNMPDPALTDWRRSYYAENHPRLAATKALYDPHRFFTFPQAIG